MIGYSDGLGGCVHLAARRLQAFERLGRGDLMNQMQVDIQNGVAGVVSCDNMAVPQLVIQRAQLTHHTITF